MKKLPLMLAVGALAFPLVFTQPAQPASAADADNTKRNTRDADGTTLTPLDQGESEADRTITQQIRKAVVADGNLSTNAQNVKIITRDGVVTLRGPVKSPEEKATIASFAQKTGGVKRVDNQLEIERN